MSKLINENKILIIISVNKYNKYNKIPSFYYFKYNTDLELVVNIL